MVLRDGVSKKVSKSKYKIRYNFMRDTLIFQFLYVGLNVLNYRYFHTDFSTFLKNKKRWKNNKKTLKTRFYTNIKSVYKRLLQLWYNVH